MPADNCRGLHDDQAVLPAAPQAAKQDPVDPIQPSHPRPRHAALEHGELLAEREVFEGECCARDQQGPQVGKDDHGMDIGGALRETSAMRAGPAQDAPRSTLLARGWGFWEARVRKNCASGNLWIRILGTNKSLLPEILSDDHIEYCTCLVQIMFS